MNDPNEIPHDEILPEYSLEGGVRGKYATRYTAGTNLARLDTNNIQNAITCNPDSAEWPRPGDPPAGHS
jgi:hypothetical protein